jgi:uncharacterized protein YeaC (DUF1315 family)
METAVKRPVGERNQRLGQAVELACWPDGIPVRRTEFRSRRTGSLILNDHDRHVGPTVP